MAIHGDSSRVKEASNNRRKQETLTTMKVMLLKPQNDNFSQSWQSSST